MESNSKIITSYIHLLIVCCFLLMSGCSAIVYERNLMTNTGSNNWEKVTPLNTTYSKEDAQYKDNIISITTLSSYDLGSCPISMGPPIVPVIPLFFFCFGSNPNLHLGLLIENFSDELTIDIQGIELLKSGNQSVPLYRAHYCIAGEGYYSRHCQPDKQAEKNDLSFPITLNKGKYILGLSYLGIGTPNELTVVLGKISSRGKQINVPPLRLKRSDNVVYVPLMLSGHEPVFRQKLGQ